MAKSKGPLFPNPSNETTPEDVGEGDVYFSYDEVMKAHLSQDGGSFDSTPNSDSGAGIMGGVNPGEPSPFKKGK